MGFEFNLYNECFSNKVIEVRQCTILCHVDDINVSHVESKVVSKMLGDLEKEYGKYAPLIVSCGKWHTLWCYKRFSPNHNVNMFAEPPPVMDGESSTPAPLHLFAVNEEAVMLSEKVAQFFHNTVANSLFLYKRVCP